MPPLTKAEITELTDQWGGIAASIQKEEAKKLRAIEPVIQRHNEELEGVSRKFDTKIAKLRGELEAVEKQVLPWLEKRSKDVVVAGETAVAERRTETRLRSRIVNFEKFWKLAQAKGQAAVDCINVQVGKAEKLLGKKTIDEISDTDSSESVIVELRLKD